MVNVVLYGDRHNSEEAAQKIHRGINSQKPEVVLYEFDIKGKKFDYMKQSLANYGTISDIYDVFGADSASSEFAEVEELPLYDLESETIVNLKREIFSGKAKKKAMKVISSPNDTLKGPEVDKALYSILIQFNIRKMDDRNTLPSRIFFEAQKIGFAVERIDIDRNEMWVHGAKKISELPNDPDKVKKRYKQVRSGQINNQLVLMTGSQKQRIADGVKKLINEFDNPRNDLMASQVEDIIESKGYNNVAVIVGRDHLKPIGKFLSRQKGYNIDARDPIGSSGFLTSLKDTLF